MEFKAKEIAALLKGVIEGDQEVVVSNVSKIEDGKPGTLAFLANLKYENYIYTTNASIVLVDKTFVPKQPVKATLLRVDSAYDAFATLLQLYESMRPKPVGIEQPSFIAEGVKLGEELYVGAFAYIAKGVKLGRGVKIHPHCYIGPGVSIGDDTILYAGVKIYEGCVVGSSCIIHAGAVIGSDGFGFAPEGDHYKKIPQIGNVVVGNNVEIGANTCIDRATMGSTVIGDGVKLDNLIQIAHNVVVGSNTAMAAQAGVAGSTKIGEHCLIGGQVGIAGHLQVGAGTQIAAQSGVVQCLPNEASTLMGTPAFNVRSFQKAHIIFKKLPEIYTQINQHEKDIKELKSK